jgi:Tol biopolymer transport system component
MIDRPERWKRVVFVILTVGACVALGASAAQSKSAARLIAFSATVGKYDDIYVIRADGTGRRRVTRTKAEEYCPTWSPDGRKIALLAFRGERPLGLQVITPAGTRLWRAPANYGCPSWSPDGRMLAYFRDTSSGVALEVVGADGRGHRRIVTDVDHRLHEGVPAWSPDSKEIAYAFEGDDERFVIRIVNVEEGQTRLVQVSRAPDFCSDYCQL